MVTGPESLELAVWAALSGVADPEIPAVSVVDMGMIRDVVVDAQAVTVTVLPTFTGCPAIDVITHDVGEAVGRVEGAEKVVVKTSFDPPWTTDRITPEGKAKLQGFGLAPPTGTGPVLITDIGLPGAARCPYCSSTNTKNDSMFGPTPCRAIYYCLDCRNPFEQFKTV